MPHPTSPLSPDLYIANIFNSKAVQKGAVIRRKLRDIERFAGRAAFKAELDRRGYRAIVNADQVVIFCNREPLRPFA